MRKTRVTKTQWREIVSKKAYGLNEERARERRRADWDDASDFLRGHATGCFGDEVVRSLAKKLYEARKELRALEDWKSAEVLIGEAFEVSSC